MHIHAVPSDYEDTFGRVTSTTPLSRYSQHCALTKKDMTGEEGKLMMYMYTFYLSGL